VLFQMGVNDSSTLIDSPLASRLGLHRALFASEEMAMPEKFRPYSLPEEEWLEGVRVALRRRDGAETPSVQAEPLAAGGGTSAGINRA
jgi:S-DNA-T family DNA segregation ATPase FtsK/SpoIIIE